MIHEFKGEYKWLSNFEPVNITIDGITYPSVEHAYMSAKCDDPEWKKYCSDSNNTAGDVKRKSREVKLVDNWDTLKFDIMETCLMKKYRQEPFSSRLINTGNQNIVEGNYFGDTVWGVDLKSSPNVGENHLGRMIMLIRNTLNKERRSSVSIVNNRFKLENVTEQNDDSDVLGEAEYLFKFINDVTSGVSKGQEVLLEHLYFDKQRLSKIFNIYEKDENGETVSGFIDEQHGNFDKAKQDLFVTKEEIDELEKIVFSLTKEDAMTETVKSLFITTNNINSKFSSLLGYAYNISRQKGEMYLRLCEEKL